MAVTERKQQALAQKRARALAMMLLTRRAGLLIEEVTDDIGLDYIVRFHSQGKEGLREFGIELRARRSAATKEEADKVLRPALRQVQRYGPFLRPVCLFFFTMEEEGAWYTWVAEPIVAVDAQPLLRVLDGPNCGPLNDRALDEIVKQVDAWHDAGFASLVVNGAAASKRRR